MEQTLVAHGLQLYWSGAPGLQIWCEQLLAPPLEHWPF
jgi:hypothetical protein